MAPRTTCPLMSGDEYMAALAAIGFHPEHAPTQAATWLGIGVRTSFRYASAGGVPRATALLLRYMVANSLRPEDIALAARPLRLRG